MKKRNYSETIAKAVSSFLENDDWNFTFDDKAGMFKFGLNIKCKMRNIQFTVQINEDSFTVYGYSPVNTDSENADMTVKMAEYICKANYGLINGNFEFDMSDGEIRYKSHVDCEGMKVPPSAEIIRNSIYRTAMTFERYGTGIVDIIFGSSLSGSEPSPEITKLIEAIGELGPDDEATPGLISELAAVINKMRRGNTGDAGINMDIFDLNDDEAEGGAA